MIGVIDYKMGNLGSVMNALKFIGAEARLYDTPDGLEDCDAVIFPGQGAFRDCMKNCEEHGFVPTLKDWMESGRPFLGVCMGLQLLFEDSEESPGTAGLGVFPGRVKRFPGGSGMKVPQMGWNTVRQQYVESPLFQGVADESWFYFVHSFYIPFDGQEWAAGLTDFGLTYTSILSRDNILACQFHPEKSQSVGVQLLRNFVDWSQQRVE